MCLSDSSTCDSVEVMTLLFAVGSLLYLQKAGDVSFVADPHGDHVFKQPEEWSLVARLWPCLVQQAVKLEEQPASSLCGTRRSLRVTQDVPRHHSEPSQVRPHGVFWSLFAWKMSNQGVVHQFHHNTILYWTCLDEDTNFANITKSIVIQFCD